MYSTVFYITFLVLSCVLSTHNNNRICRVCAGNSIDFESDSTDKSQPSEIKTEDITEHDDKPRSSLHSVHDEQFTQGHLNVQKQTHVGQNMYSCGECEKSFSSQVALSCHRNIHTGKYMCTECGKCFGSSSDLTRHGRSHSGERPFECYVCGKRFTRAEYLVKHGRIHSGDKPYKCHMCDEAFSKSGDLNSHMRVHAGDRPYSCRQCSKCFARPDQLESHLLKSHSGGT